MNNNTLENQVLVNKFLASLCYLNLPVNRTELYGGGGVIR